MRQMWAGIDACAQHAEFFPWTGRGLKLAQLGGKPPAKLSIDRASGCLDVETRHSAVVVRGLSAPTRSLPSRRTRTTHVRPDRFCAARIRPISDGLYGSPGVQPKIGRLGRPMYVDLELSPRSDQGLNCREIGGGSTPSF